MRATGAWISTVLLVEALLPFALTWVGEPLATAVLGVVAYRIVNVWLPLGPALAGRFALRRWALVAEPDSVGAGRRD